MKLGDNSKWLSAKACAENDIVKFLDSGEWIESRKYTYDDGNPVNQLVFKVLHEGEEKKLGVIVASRTNLINAWGNDTDEWIGKEAIINLALNNKGGKSILLSPKDIQLDAKKEFPPVNEDIFAGSEGECDEPEA